MKANVYQIYYSNETRASLDPGFIPLDNTGNRPDWREYWPMREFLLESTLNPNEYYGFFSPKFGQKTGLTSHRVLKFIESSPENIDVVTFSPFFDMAASLINIFEHAVFAHVGIAPLIDGVVDLLTPGLNWRAMIMTSPEFVFCNYFVAKPAFWEEWLNMCETLFAVAESNDGELAQRLNADIGYVKDSAPSKVFIIERIASLILGTQPHWRVRSYNSIVLPTSAHPVRHYRTELLTLDGLKHAARNTGLGEYVAAFRKRQAELFDQAQAREAMTQTQ